MSDNANKPTHRVLAILPRGDKKPFWQQIGAGWTNSDGSINIKLSLYPADPSVTLQIRRADEPAKDEEE